MRANWLFLSLALAGLGMLMGPVRPTRATCLSNNQLIICGHAVTYTDPAHGDSVQYCGVVGGDCILPRDVAAYDIPAGLTRASQDVVCGMGYTVSAQSQDQYWIVGPESPDPIPFTAQLALTGGGNCGATGAVSFTVQAQTSSASLSVVPAPGPSCAATPPLPPSLVVPVSALVGSPFSVQVGVSVQVRNAAGGRSFLTAQLTFTGLPAGYTVVSCNGFGRSGSTPVPAMSWGKLKYMYR